MDETRLEAAEKAYAAGEWEIAAREFLSAAADGVSGSGYALHRAGNALMRLGRLADACVVYERALADDSYQGVAAVARNLGTAKMSLGKPEAAASAFRQALEASAPGDRHKALQGLAGALFDLGEIEEAAELYRQAALEASNPDPGRALNNLGLCYMALGRPEDAVQAYKAALELPDYAGRGRAAANLGMAYAALGMHERAVASFEEARDVFGHSLLPATESAYQASKAAVKEAGQEGLVADIASETAPPRPVMPPVFEEGESEGEEEAPFFTMTDEEMKVADREMRRQERLKRREQKPWWVTALTWGAIAVVIAGLLVGAYLMGYGYPTQEMTVNGVLGAYSAGEDVTSYWVAVPASDVDKAMSALPPSWESYTIKDVQRSARSSTVDVSVVHEQGGEITYRFSLSREGVGWKINGVVTAFDSMEGGI